ncbi:hypothetical protein ABK040_009182 [Willaertia magna]
MSSSSRLTTTEAIKSLQLIHQSGFFPSNYSTTTTTITTTTIAVVDQKKQKFLFFQCWAPFDFQNSLGTIVIFHGINEHCSRYEKLVEFFVKERFIVYSFDLEGHGLSDGKKGFVKNFNDWIDQSILFLDLIVNNKLLEAAQEILKITKKDFYFEKTNIIKLKEILNCEINNLNDKNIYLFGQGIGGLICLYNSLQRKEIVKGMILSSPMLKVPITLHSFLQKIAKSIVTCAPNLPILELHLEKRTHSQDEINIFKKDPLTIKDKVKAKICYDILEIIKNIKPIFESIETPFLLFHGTDDEYCDIEGSKNLMEFSEKCLDKTFEMCAGLYHDLLFEICAENLMNKMVTWIGKRNRKLNHQSVSLNYK